MAKKISADTPVVETHKILLKDLDRIFGSVEKLASCSKLPVKMMYWLGSSVEEGRKHLRLAADTQKKMVKEYGHHPVCPACQGKPTEEGKEPCSSCKGSGLVEADFSVPDDQRSDYMSKMEALMDTEVSWNFPKITLGVLMDKADPEKCVVEGFSSSDFANLSGFISE